MRMLQHRDKKGQRNGRNGLTPSHALVSVACSVPLTQFGTIAASVCDRRVVTAHKTLHAHPRAGESLAAMAE